MWNQGDYRRGSDLAEASIDLLDRLGTETVDAVDAVAARNALAMLRTPPWQLTREQPEIFEAAAALARASGNDLATRDRPRQRREPGARSARLLTVHEPISRRSWRSDGAWDKRPSLANALVDLGFIELTKIGPGRGCRGFRREPRHLPRGTRYAHLVWIVEGLAAVALARDAPAVATRLLAATGSLRTEIGFAEGYYSIGDEVRERTLKDARELLGDAAFATAWTDGENLSVEELAEEATLVD